VWNGYAVAVRDGGGAMPEVGGTRRTTARSNGRPRTVSEGFEGEAQHPLASLM